MHKGKMLLLIVLALALVGSSLWLRNMKRRTITLTGAVITENSDPRKERPIADALITAADTESHSVSDSSGLFTLNLRRRLLRHRREITLHFRHPAYEPLDLTIPVSDKISVASMIPLTRQNPAPDNVPAQIVANVVARYSIKAATEVNVGSTVRTFEAVNKGNVPCNGRFPCSPDRKWKGSRGSVSLDAGAGNEFRNTRASCIAGPCPFTRIENSRLTRAGRTITISALAWSDTATFLVEAEVVHPMVSDMVRNLYPVIFGNTLNFTLPPAAEGVSLQADLNGQMVIFPLGPSLVLDWAECNGRINPDQTRVYRCELKPGYRWLNSSS
ncbi:MAG: carboxypeptidase regulatory-like domain-containing protein [Acidobacteria bacterium]|nr:carboxypeptidase regulatory-like domain-containing protein [Acidobacteriota bacterium]